LNEDVMKKYKNSEYVRRYGLSQDVMLQLARLNEAGKYELGHFLWMLLLLLELKGSDG